MGWIILGILLGVLIGGGLVILIVREAVKGAIGRGLNL